MTDLHHPSSPPPTSTYDYGYPPATAGTLERRRTNNVPWLVAGAAVVVAVGAMTFGVQARSAGDGLRALNEPTQTSLGANQDPATSQEDVCKVLREGYPTVLGAIHESNQFLTSPWSDPNRVRVSNVLARETWRLADQLDAALGDETQPEFRTVMIEYITGLRATSMTERDHGADEQINGVGTLFNQSRHGALRACGMDDR